MKYLLFKVAATFLLILAFTSAPAGVQPPWSAPLVQGFNFTVPGIDNAPDFHGDINTPQLVIFFAGNQYMVVNDLLRTFNRTHPRYRRVFAETLPPGKLVAQIEDGTLVMGNMAIRLRPDVFTAGHGRVKQLQHSKQWFSRIRDYARNRLAIMTYRGNPYGIKNWRDLARAGLPICMPNPKFEGIAEHAVIPALKAAGGAHLIKTIYTSKVANGSTFLTRIHHRQTPLRIMRRECAAGAVWYSEAYFQADIAHHAISTVQLPERENHTVTYSAAIMKNAPHTKAARAFLQFLTSQAGQAIYRKYGFMPLGSAP